MEFNENGIKTTKAAYYNNTFYQLYQCIDVSTLLEDLKQDIII